MSSAGLGVSQRLARLLNEAGVSRRYLGTKEAAEFIRHSHRTLEDWRLKGIGPPFQRRSRRILYVVDDLIAWIDASDGSGDAPP